MKLPLSYTLPSFGKKVSDAVRAGNISVVQKNKIIEILSQQIENLTSQK
jgi:hypothetical protein